MLKNAGSSVAAWCYPKFSRFQPACAHQSSAMCEFRTYFLIFKFPVWHILKISGNSSLSLLRRRQYCSHFKPITCSIWTVKSIDISGHLPSPSLTAGEADFRSTIQAADLPPGPAEILKQKMAFTFFARPGSCDNQRNQQERKGKRPFSIQRQASVKLHGSFPLWYFK